LTKTFLIYNPNAGAIRRHPHRLPKSVDILRRQGFEVTLTPTAGPNQAGDLARSCLDQGAERLLIAGGDGTLNEALNGIVGSRVPIGLLPGGTANVFAMETGIGKRMVRAAREHHACVPVRVALGRLSASGEPPRYFLLMAGAGLDAKIVHLVKPQWKNLLGKASYWIGGFSQLGRRLDEFEVHMNGRVHKASFALFSRVKNYGGDLEIARHADLLSDDLAVVLFAGRSSIPYLKYFAGVLFNRLAGMRGVTLAHATAVELRPCDGPDAAIQLDGEAYGFVPARLEIVPDALTFLLPEPFAAQSELRRLANSVSNVS
jgi:diacylglycerol kinase family enzyme